MGISNMFVWRRAVPVVHLMCVFVACRWRTAGLVCFLYAWFIVVRWLSLFVVSCALFVCSDGKRLAFVDGFGCRFSFGLCWICLIAGFDSFVASVWSSLSLVWV